MQSIDNTDANTTNNNHDSKESYGGKTAVNHGKQSVNVLLASGAGSNNHHRKSRQSLIQPPESQTAEILNSSSLSPRTLALKANM